MGQKIALNYFKKNYDKCNDKISFYNNFIPI